MCPARLNPPRDPRLRDPPRRPEVEKPQETRPVWHGVLLMPDRHGVLQRIAEVTCRPAPPVPLPERVQLNKSFWKLDPVCIGLPFFELHKTNFKYHPESQWSQFLDFLFKRKRLATITCVAGWELFVQPPVDGPPDGFRFVRVHYRRTHVHNPEEERELVQGPAPSIQDWVSEPALPDTAMEVESQEVVKRVIDYTAKLCCQPKPKRPRVEGVFSGSGNTGPDVPSSSGENDLQEIVAKASEKPKSIGNCVTDISYDIARTVDHVRKLPSRGDDGSVADKGNVACNGVASEEQVPKPSSQVALGAVSGNEVWRKKYVAEAPVPRTPSGGSGGGAVEKPSEASGSARGGLKENVPEMVVSHGATSGAVPASEDWFETGLEKLRLAEPAVSRAPSGGRGSGAMGKASGGSGSAQGVLKERVPMFPLGKVNDLSNGAMSIAFGKEQSKYPKELSPTRMTALRKSLQSNEKLKDVQHTSSKVDVSIPTSYTNGDSRLHKGSQVAGKGKGLSNGDVGVSLKKQVPKPSSNGIEKIKKRSGKITKHIVHALPKVPDQFRVLSSGGGMGASSKEQMPKPPSCADGAFQKQKCSQPEAKLQGVKENLDARSMPSSSSFEISTELKSSKVAVKLNGVTDAPSSSCDRNSQKTGRSGAFSNGVRRSEPQKIKLKKSSTEGSSEDEGSASSTSKKGNNGWQHWIRVIENVLELMYLAEDRNATKVDVGVEEVRWHEKKRNELTVIVGDNGEGMSSREVNQFFDEKIKDIPADYLVLLTKTKTEQLVGFSYQNNLKVLSHSIYDHEDPLPDVLRGSIEFVLQDIMAASPFSSNYIESELAKLDTTGTRMIVYGYGDLVFNGNEDFSQEIFFETLHKYVQAMYYVPQVTIHVQDTKVNMSLAERPSSAETCLELVNKHELKVSLLFDEAYSRFETYGICLYYQNRLLEGHAFLKVGKMDGDANYGCGVVGVVDITPLIDFGDDRLNFCGSQIDLKRNKHYNSLMQRLADVVHEFCDDYLPVYLRELSEVVGNDRTKDAPKGNALTGVTGGNGEVVGDGETRDVPKGKALSGCALTGVTSTSLQLPKIGESSSENFLAEGHEYEYSSDECEVDDNLEDLSDEYEVEEILDVKLEFGEVYYYVKWVGYYTNESTWEPSTNLRNAPNKIREYFDLFPCRRKEIVALKRDAFEDDDESEDEVK